jgi:hypothetical protein
MTFKGVERLARLVADLQCRPGYSFEGQAPELHVPHIGWAIRAGQYVLMTHPATERLLGFASWWLLNDHELMLVKTRGSAALLAEKHDPAPLNRGRNAHIALVVTAPWAPRATYGALVSLTKGAIQRQSEVTTISSVMAKRDGRRFWHERRVAA